MTPQQYEQLHDIESRLYLNDADGADLHALLVAQRRLRSSIGSPLSRRSPAHR